MLQVESLGLRAFQMLIQAGSSEIVAGVGLTELQHASGILERREQIFIDLMQMTQIARQALEHRLRRRGAHVIRLERHVGPELTQQQFSTVLGVQPAAVAWVQRVVGAGHAQQKMAGKVDPLQRNLQAPCELQCDHRQTEWLTSTTLHHLVQQSDLRFGLCHVILLKTDAGHVAQQGLSEFCGGQQRKGSTDPALQLRDEFAGLLGLDLSVVFDRYPKRCLERRGRRAL